jgi:DNA-binding transcriptional ArsR family regulator
MVANQKLEQQVFKALADPTRRAIVALLSEGSQPMGAIAGEFRISRPGVSKHLRALREAGLVRERREGRHRIYELDAEPLRIADEWIGFYRHMWVHKLRNLKRFLEARETPDRRS